MAPKSQYIQFSLFLFLPQQHEIQLSIFASCFEWGNMVLLSNTKERNRAFHHKETVIIIHDLSCCLSYKELSSQILTLLESRHAKYPSNILTACNVINLLSNDQQLYWSAIDVKLVAKIITCFITHSRRYKNYPFSWLIKTTKWIDHQFSTTYNELNLRKEEKLRH